MDTRIAHGDLEEQIFRGPLHQQVRECLRYLGNLSTSQFRKHSDRVETTGWVSFPLPALEETLVNAVYHRSYDSTPEPVKVYLYPDRMEITSYPGPPAGLKPEHFTPGGRVPNVPLRNRRIGELLKELRLAEARGTGVPKVFRAMAENGSPTPRFEFDAERTYFTAILPAHPDYVAMTALREFSTLLATGDRALAIKSLASAAKALPSAGSISARLIDELARDGDLASARVTYDTFRKQGSKSNEPLVIAAMAEAYLNSGDETEAKRVLDQMPSISSEREAAQMAILERRAKRQRHAHALFERAGESILHDARSLHEFAQTKMYLAGDLRRSQSRYDQATRKTLLRDAERLLQRVLQMDTPTTRQAWAWYNLGQVRQWLGEPSSEVRHAYESAIALLPAEPRFRDSLSRLN